MKKIYYNKLIRDKVPQKMELKGCQFKIKKLNRTEFEKELLKKVSEEAGGLLTVNGKKELISELADVLDVVDEIKKFKKITNKQITAAQKENFEKKGGFIKRIFLYWSADDGYKTNEKKFRKPM